MKKLFLIAGETSGDAHGAALIRAITLHEKNIQIHAWGGDQMKAAGARIEKHIDELSIMGFTQVLWEIRKIKSWFTSCKKQINTCQPDAIIFIDFAGFNLRMAKWAKKQGYLTFYFIPPKTWAWNEGRTTQLKRNIDFIIPILPFEEPYFKSKGLEVAYFGNPLVQKIEAFKQANIIDNIRSRKTIGLFPGSRKQELDYILPVFSKIIVNNPELTFTVSALSSLDNNIYKNALPDERKFSNYNIVYDKPYEILHSMEKAICTSGTITLEAALFNIPQVVVYKTNMLNYSIAKRYIKTQFISLPNLILDRSEIPELLQNQCNANEIISALQKLNIQKVHSAYEAIKAKLYEENSLEEVAKFIIMRIK